MSHKQNQELLNRLSTCAAVCNHCATACLDEEDVKMLARCIKLDTDCAEICRITASFVARGSEHAQHLLRESAEICVACASECEKHANHMDHCRECAEVCRQCAEACTSHVEVV
jgi:hypothetical protein